MGNGEWGMGNGEWGMGNGESGIGNRDPPLTPTSAYATSVGWANYPSNTN
ncbi:hypothetical protein [Moorena sp. SIO4G3]|nr:hypothetical protein [Moorena sp. SIO4G3]NEO75924.1 hypothetical protein [Moorena sp. SIO4G3]